MIGLIVFLLFVSFFLYIPIYLVWAIRKDFLHNRKREKESLVEAKLWLIEELSKPKYHVVVNTNSGLELHSRFFEPHYSFSIFNTYLSKQTSLDMANTVIESAIELGRYHDSDSNLFIPMCEIKSLRAEKQTDDLQ